MSLLEKGLSFIPSTRSMKLVDFCNYRDRLIRRIKLFDFFKDDSSTYKPNDFCNKFIGLSSWTPPEFLISQQSLDTINSVLFTSDNTVRHWVTHDADRIIVNNTHNLTSGEFHAITSLKNNSDIVIKPADKGGAIVIMDKESYVKEAYRQLNNNKYYQRISASTFDINRQHINRVINTLFAKSFISSKQKSFLLGSENNKTRKFYLLPKVHKERKTWPHSNMPSGRPIVTCCGSELHIIGRFIDYFLQPLVIKSPFYIKDTYDFISKIRSQTIDPSHFLVTGDITSLYTNMDHTLIVQTLKDFFLLYPDVNRPDLELIELINITLSGNDFTFGSELFLQVLGMAMGNPCAPSTANLFLHKLDKAATTYLILVLLYNRFLDDVFFVWTGTLMELAVFETYLNTIIPNINITFTSSLVSVDFLDLTIFKHTVNGCCTLETKPFFKVTDTHQLVHKSSFHPRHTFSGIIKSQFIRLKRLSSFKEDYDKSSKILIPILRGRGYSNRLLRTLHNEVWFSFKEKSVTTLVHAKTLPVVVKYNSVGVSVVREWRSALKANSLFSDTHLITAYSVHRNLASFLIKNSISINNPNPILTPNPRGIESVKGCCRCSNIRCKACSYIVESSVFRSSKTNKTFHIRQKITCKSSNIIYLVTCGRCQL